MINPASVSLFKFLEWISRPSADETRESYVRHNNSLRLCEFKAKEYVSTALGQIRIAIGTRISIN